GPDATPAPGDVTSPARPGLRGPDRRARVYDALRQGHVASPIAGGHDTRWRRRGPAAEPGGHCAATRTEAPRDDQPEADRTDGEDEYRGLDRELQGPGVVLPVAHASSTLFGRVVVPGFAVPCSLRSRPLPASGGTPPLRYRFVVEKSAPAVVLPPCFAWGTHPASRSGSPPSGRS